jgi:hypothetical protein
MANKEQNQNEKYNPYKCVVESARNELISFARYAVNRRPDNLRCASEMHLADEYKELAKKFEQELRNLPRLTSGKRDEFLEQARRDLEDFIECAYVGSSQIESNWGW